MKKINPSLSETLPTMVSNPDSWTDAAMKGSGNTDDAKKKKSKKKTTKKSWSY